MKLLLLAVALALAAASEVDGLIEYQAPEGAVVKARKASLSVGDVNVRVHPAGRGYAKLMKSKPSAVVVDGRRGWLYAEDEPAEPSDPHGPPRDIPKVKAYYALVPLQGQRALVFSTKEKPGEEGALERLQSFLQTVKFKKSKRR